MPISSRSNRRKTMSETVTRPSDFEDVWKIVEGLRSTRDAPVDLWGCDKVVDPKAPVDVFEFQILVAAMLSSQTKDRMVKAGMDNLLRNDLSISGILSMTETEIDSHISMVGFHTTKARNIRAVAKLLRNEYSSRVPRSFVHSPRVVRAACTTPVPCARPVYNTRRVASVYRSHPTRRRYHRARSRAAVTSAS